MLMMCCMCLGCVCVNSIVIVLLIEWLMILIGCMLMCILMVCCMCLICVVSEIVLGGVV